jgi:peptide-methionine (S)-S-oxide reductase
MSKSGELGRYDLATTGQASRRPFGRPAPGGKLLQAMVLSALAMAVTAGCTPEYQPEVPSADANAAAPAPASGENGAPLAAAVLAGGCFWCTEADFEKVPGVVSAVSGYAGGTTAAPTYEQVSAGGTGHYEVVEIRYDPRRVSYASLIDYYFRTVDPTDAGGQFCDRGESYRTAIFAGDPAERAIAAREKDEAAAKLGQAVATPILPAARFWPAEGYHQDYYKKNALKYGYYRSRCGRDARLQELWGKSGAK